MRSQQSRRAPLVRRSKDRSATRKSALVRRDDRAWNREPDSPLTDGDSLGVEPDRNRCHNAVLARIDPRNRAAVAIHDPHGTEPDRDTPWFASHGMVRVGRPVAESIRQTTSSATSVAQRAPSPTARAVSSVPTRVVDSGFRAASSTRTRRPSWQPIHTVPVSIPLPIGTQSRGRTSSRWTSPPGVTTSVSGSASRLTHRPLGPSARTG